MAVIRGLLVLCYSGIEMAVLLKDKELKALIGTVIVNGDISCVRPNSYILRLGSKGEFLNSGKEFNLGKKKKGIRVHPGHSVAVTAHEELDFGRETVHKFYPGDDLHGMISPTTDLSREGLVAPSTQVDAGYHGTPNWTIANTSNQERRFTFKERIFRLIIFRLSGGETPDELYAGDYQDQTGYVPSRRRGAPVGMRDSEWEDSVVQGGPEEMLENLVKSGYPWNLLGERLKIIDRQFETVTNEYSNIGDSIDALKNEMKEIRNGLRGVLMEEATSLQNRWLLGTGSVIVGFAGLTLTVMSNEPSLAFVKQYGVFVGLFFVLAAVSTTYLISRRK